ARPRPWRARPATCRPTTARRRPASTPRSTATRAARATPSPPRSGRSRRDTGLRSTRAAGPSPTGPHGCRSTRRCSDRRPRWDRLTRALRPAWRPLLRVRDDPNSGWHWVPRSPERPRILMEDMDDPSHFPLPITGEDIDPAWLTAALRPRAPGVTVHSIEVVDVLNPPTTKVRLRLDRDATAIAAGIPA